MLHDEYKDGGPKDSGPWLRRWSLVAGQPRCVEDAVSLDHPDADAIRARNDRVRQAVETVEGFEAAERLIAHLEALGVVKPHDRESKRHTLARILSRLRLDAHEAAMLDGWAWALRKRGAP